MTSKLIFISHAEKDQPLADALVDCLVTGIGVPLDSIFCSSLEGMGIPEGTDFVDFIREQLDQPKLVILLLTPHYYHSLFCLCELGASWALAHSVFPLLVPPLTYRDMKVVLERQQAARIDDPSDLSNLKDRVVSDLALSKVSSARWEIKRDAFLEELDTILKGIEPPRRVTAKKFDELQSKYDDSKAALEEDQQEIKQLKAEIDDLRRCKDADEARVIAISHSDNWEAFEQLTAAAAAALAKLPTVVSEVLMHDRIGVAFNPDRFSEPQKCDEVDEAIKDDLIVITDNDVEANTHDPKVSRASDAVDELAEYLYEMFEADDGFEKQYTERHDHQPKMSSRQFWRQHLL